MCEISYNGIITVNRGDSFSIDIPLSTGSTLFPVKFALDKGDFVYLGVMEPNQPFEDAIIRKMFPGDNHIGQDFASFEFTPDDTRCLLPGRYYYQVKISKSNPHNKVGYNVYTLVDKTQFFITD